MANLNGSLSLADIDTRFTEALRDSSVASATRYRYLQDAYSRIWYKHPWSFRHESTTFTAASSTSAYTLTGQVDEIAAIFNVSKQKYISMNKDIYMYFQSYADDNHSGALYNAIDIVEDGPNTVLYFQETPESGASGMGVGDTIQVYYCKHIIHNNSAGATATGNMATGSDVPSFAPQFHQLIAKEALIEAIKNRRDFQEMYQISTKERDEMLFDMKRRYFSPRQGKVAITYR